MLAGQASFSIRSFSSAPAVSAVLTVFVMSKESGTMFVSFKTEEVLYPLEPAVPHPPLLRLSNNDQIMPRLYTSMLFFFPYNADCKSREEIGKVLRESLREVLTIFYPLAGRYTPRIDGGLDVECADQGILFCEAWTDADLAATFGPDFQPCPHFELLVPKPDIFANISDIHILQIQVTHFGCGGFCVGIQVHHNVGDGISVSHFLQSWSEIASSKGQVTLYPTFDRCPLLPRDPPSPSSPHLEYQTTMPEIPSPWPDMASRIFTLTPAHLAALKAKASESTTRVTSYSNFEVVAAFVWRSVMEVRHMEPGQEVRLGMAVDGRKRFTPPLGEGYFGNVNFYGFCATGAGQLVEKPLAYAAELVKQAVATVTEEQMRSALDWVEMQASPTSIVASFCRPFHDVAITSWWRFPVYGVDFGWGKPAFVRIPTFAFDGLVVILPSPLGPDHMDVLVGLKVEQMPTMEGLFHALPH